MEHEKAVEVLKRQIEKSKPLVSLKRFGPEWEKWHRDTEVAIQRIFGAGSRHENDFTGISYSPSVTVSGMSGAYILQRYTEGLETARQILTSMIEELEDFGISSLDDRTDVRIALGGVFDRFHLVARQLRSRHAQRSTLEIEDEYDIQDLMHALLHLVCEDIRDEEWTPSYAGGSSRVDFLLKKEKIVVEVKKTRKDLTLRSIGEQLIIDIARYQSHPDCKKLICFVYDPEGRIGNPVGLESDLTKKHGELPVTVIVCPKGR
jgi:hypothetical protein